MRLTMPDEDIADYSWAPETQSHRSACRGEETKNAFFQPINQIKKLGVVTGSEKKSQHQL